MLCENRPIFSDRTIFSLSSSVRAGIASTTHITHRDLSNFERSLDQITQKYRVKKKYIVSKIKTSTEKEVKIDIVCEWFSSVDKPSVQTANEKKNPSSSLEIEKKNDTLDENIRRFYFFVITNFVICFFVHLCVCVWVSVIWKREKKRIRKSLNHIINRGNGNVLRWDDQLARIILRLSAYLYWFLFILSEFFFPLQSYVNNNIINRIWTTKKNRWLLLDRCHEKHLCDMNDWDTSKEPKIRISAKEINKGGFPFCILRRHRHNLR